MSITLSELKSGQKGKIIQIGGTGALKRRLFNLGILSGETVKMIKSAPLRDPLEIAIGNSHLSIRRSEASLITMEIAKERAVENE